MEQDCQSAADLAAFLGHFREEEKRPGHHCWRMRVIPIKTWEFVYVRILSVYFPVVCPYMVVILTSGSMACTRRVVILPLSIVL